MIEKIMLSEKQFRPFHSIRNICICSHFFYQFIPLSGFVAEKFYMKGLILKVNKNIRIHGIRLASNWHLRYTNIKSRP